MMSSALMWVSFVVAAVTTYWSIRSIAETRRMRHEVAAERYRKRTAWAPVKGVPMGDEFHITAKCNCGLPVELRIVATPQMVPVGVSSNFNGDKAVVMGLGRPRRG